MRHGRRPAARPVMALQSRAMHLPLLLLALWTFGRLDVSTCAQSRQIPAPSQHAPVLIEHATIHTVAGATIQRGHILFSGGRITQLGEGELPGFAGQPPDRIDATGLHVYPGLISAVSALGLVETASTPVTIDTTELGRVTPEVRAAVAVNPDTELIPVARANGILTACLFPRGGAISGRASTIRLDGWTWEDMAIDGEAGLVVNWPRTEIIDPEWIEKSETEQRKEMAEDQEALKRVFEDAAAYLKAKDNDPATPTDLRYEAMRDALAGAKPVFITAASQGQIESAVAWAVRLGLRPIIVGGQQADRCAALLRKHDVPVIVNGIHQLPPRRHSDYDAAYTLPARLHAAGITFALASGEEPAHERNLNHHAATACAYGLPQDEALRAVTLTPARLLGLGATHGSLEVGKSATLILTTGDPLEITTDVLAAYIDGRQIDLGNRQKFLNDKYREKYRQLKLLN
jgi:imidazolonepropionase-like amidohydrolase